jgi:threonyl-tRNA synthetase
MPPPTPGCDSSPIRGAQMSTVQYDFNQPARFGLEYQGDDGARHQPVMIHSAKFGSIERFIGVLTEHYAGAFPAWLAPVQAIAIPVTDDQVGYLHDVAKALKKLGIRIDVDDAPDRMQKKIRTAQRSKVPFMLIAGATDADAGAVSFRYLDGTQRNGIAIADAAQEIAGFIAARINTAPTAESFGPAADAPALTD